MMMATVDTPRRDNHQALQPFDDSVDESPPSDAVVQHQLPPTTRQQQMVVLICSFMAVVMTIGPSLSYGVFQEYYVTSSNTILPSAEAKNRSIVALVGTLAAGLTWSGSIFVNPLMSRVKGNANQKISIAGCCLMSLSLALAGSAGRVSRFHSPVSSYLSP